MRKLFFLFAFMLSAAFCKAQVTVTNNTACEMEVWQLCYDTNCNYLKETLYKIPQVASIVIPDCIAPNQTGYFIRHSLNDCWAGSLQLLPLNCPGSINNGTNWLLSQTLTCACNGGAPVKIS